MDKTTRIDPSARRDDPRVITLPRKERVNLALAAVAVALGVLVLFSAPGAFSRRFQGGPTAAPATPLASPSRAHTDRPKPTERTPNGLEDD